MEDWLRKILHSSNIRLDVERIWVSVKSIKKSLMRMRFGLNGKIRIASRLIRNFYGCAISLISESSHAFNSKDTLPCRYELFLTIIIECGFGLENKQCNFSFVKDI
jgi:hypothetical protein